MPKFGIQTTRTLQKKSSISAESSRRDTSKSEVFSVLGALACTHDLLKVRPTCHYGVFFAQCLCGCIRACLATRNWTRECAGRSNVLNTFGSAVPRRACVEPRPLVQTGPQGDSLLACGTRQRRRPSRLERARRREAHWTVVASPLVALSPSARSSAEIPVSWHLARSGTEEVGLFRALTF